MRKIPIGATVSRAYGFLLGEFGTILRLTWAPLLAAAALSYTYGGQIMEAAAKAGDNPQAMMEHMPAQFLLGIVGFVATIMASVALLRVVIFGDRKTGLFVYLWLGGAEIRLIIVTLLLGIAAVAAMIAAMLVFALLGALSTALPPLGIVTVVGVFAMIPLLFWVVLRLSLISPVVVAENTLGVERSWQLMAGNALRMLAVLILAYLPYIIVSVLVMLLIMGNDLPAFPKFPTAPGETPDAIKESTAAFQKALEAWQASFYGAMRAHWGEIAALNFVGSMISAALSAGVFGNAYNAITDRGAEQTFA